MKFLFYRNNEDHFHPLKLIHFLSIYSAYYHNSFLAPEVVLVQNSYSTSDWIPILKSLIPDFKLIVDDISKSECIKKYGQGSIYIELGMIFIKPFGEYSELDELALLDFRNKYYSYSEGVADLIVFLPNKKAVSDYLNLDLSLVGFKYPFPYKVLPKILFNPFDKCLAHEQYLFMYNESLSEATIGFYTYPIDWYEDRLTNLDVEHIMTVDTTFTKSVRCLVSSLNYNLINF